MKNVISTFAVLLLAVQFATAQISILPKVGLMLPSIYTGDTFANLNDKVKLRFGFQIGAGVQIPFGDKFSVQPEVLFSMKGGKSEYDAGGSPGLPVSRFTDVTNLNFIDVPILLQYKILGDLESDLHLLVEAGPYVGFGIGGTYKRDTGTQTFEGDVKFGDRPSGTSTSSNDLYFPNGTEIGVCAGVAVAKNLGSGKVVIDLRYYLAFTNLEGNESVSPGLEPPIAKNRALVLSFGYLIPIAGKK